MDAGHAGISTSSGSATGPHARERRSRAAVIFGNDAVVAARPASPGQLANACRAAGFDMVVPPSWGDELVAVALLDRLAGTTDRQIIAKTLADTLSIPIKASQIIFKDGIITVSLPPVVKSALHVQQEEILTKLRAEGIEIRGLR